MISLEKLSGERVCETAYLKCNRTGYWQIERMTFVHLDDYYAVDENGSIFQILEPGHFKEKHFEKSNEKFKEKYDFIPLLIYGGGVSGYYYNYGEDSAEFYNSDDMQTYNECLKLAQK